MPSIGRATRFKRLAKELASKAFRDSYVSSHLRGFLATQIQYLRGDMSQTEFGHLLGKPQSVISRLEDPDYGKVSLQTLFDIASKLDIALIVRFVDYPTFLKQTNDLSLQARKPESYKQDQINNLAMEQVQVTRSFNFRNATTVETGKISAVNMCGTFSTTSHSGFQQTGATVQ